MQSVVGRFGSALFPHLIKIEDLTPDPENPRLHDAENLEAIRASYRTFGQVKPIVYVETDGQKVVAAGNGQLTIAKELGWSHIAAVPFDGDMTAARAYAIADNRTGELGKWNVPVLRMQTAQLLDWKPTIDTTWRPEIIGFNAETLDAATRDPVAPRKRERPAKKAEEEIIDVEVTPVEEPPPPPPAPVKRPIPPATLVVPEVQLGDLFRLGRHLILCGDSCDPGDLNRLLGDTKVPLVHADPPYGMGKEKDGVQNDNLYASELDNFQKSWWSACRHHLLDNASAYIWGNAPDLWRLWFRHLEEAREEITVKNEIVWDKGAQPGMRSPDMRCYAPSTERCLFLMLGRQEIGNVNAASYWEGWEPLRLALKQEVESAGWTIQRVAEITGVSVRMAQHWFERSQWIFISEDHYGELQQAAAAEGCNAFSAPFDQVRDVYRQFAAQHDEQKRAFYDSRAYFDNTHDNMTEVWQFPRVTGAERWGHPTPKPVDMIARALKSSCREGEAVLEPFLGSGTTLIAAEQTGRICYGLEISPKFVATVIDRWQRLTGQQAEKCNA